jgi:hypothetical protein
VEVLKNACKLIGDVTVGDAMIRASVPLCVEFEFSIGMNGEVHDPPNYIRVDTNC